MHIDFSEGKISLVLVRSDLRYGFYKLSNIAQTYLGIDVSAGNDWVVFISRSKHLAKIIHQDDRGSLVITRKLNTGTFEQFMTKIDGPAKKTLTRDELERFLDGERLEVYRVSYSYG